MKKMLALVLVGVMAFSMPVLAAESPSASKVVEAQPTTTTNVAPAASVVTPSTVQTATGETVKVTEEIKQAAASSNLSPVEYVNNIVATIPGMKDALPIAQGGHVVINGVKTAATLNLTKPNKTEVQLATATAEALGGKALTTIGFKPSFQFKNCKVNFAVAGLKANAKIVAYQLVDGKWVAVKVGQVKDNSLELTLTNAGQLLVVELPAK